MKSARAWIRLDSGRRLNLLEPNPTSWADRDLAIGLSRTYRWGGHSIWELPLSVAQHSLLVLVLRQMLQPLERLSREEALRELLHDASEGLLSYDPISPVKPHLGHDFSTLAARMQQAVEKRYKISHFDAASYALHKQADRLAAASEAVHVAGWSDAELQEVLEIDIAPIVVDPMPLPRGMHPWEPWPARLAAALFLAKLQELQKPDAFITGWWAELQSCVERENTVAALAEAFSRLPTRGSRRCRLRPVGSSLTDILVHVEEVDGPEAVDGLLVDAERDDEGGWDFEAPFTVFTTDEELVVCPGMECDVEIQ